MASIYSHRDGFQAAVTVNGRRQKKNFATKREAERWAYAHEADLRKGAPEHLGGATRVTLGQCLFEYAKTISIHKKSCAQEIVYINRYLAAAGLPVLRYAESGNRKELRAMAPAGGKPLPAGFAQWQVSRQEERAETNALRGQLARTLMARITTAQLRALFSAMESEGLATNTQRKERALLSHLFNVAIDEWSWKGFLNPCAKIRLKKPTKVRHVVFTEKMEAALREELAKCGNPMVLPIFEFALEVSSRQSSLLKLTWDDIDFDTREMLLRDTKNSEDQFIPLSKRAMALLRALPRHVSDKKVFFNLSANALRVAFKEAATVAGLETRFRDSRHIAITRLARRLRNPQLLKRISGHRNDAMLSVYIDFVNDDVIEVLDETENEPAKGAGAAAKTAAERSGTVGGANTQAARLVKPAA